MGGQSKCSENTAAGNTAKTKPVQTGLSISGLSGIQGQPTNAQGITAQTRRMNSHGESKIRSGTEWDEEDTHQKRNSITNYSALAVVSGYGWFRRSLPSGVAPIQPALDSRFPASDTPILLSRPGCSHSGDTCLKNSMYITSEEEGSQRSKKC